MRIIIVEKISKRDKNKFAELEKLSLEILKFKYKTYLCRNNYIIKYRECKIYSESTEYFVIFNTGIKFDFCLTNGDVQIAFKNQTNSTFFGKSFYGFFNDKHLMWKEIQKTIKNSLLDKWICGQ